METNTPAATNNNIGVATQPRPKIEVLKNVMKADSVQEQFKNVLKENASAFMASVIDLYNGDQYLQNCNPQQVVMEALKAATLKLPINKNLGFAYIVPYNNSAQMQIGYKGLIQLAMRTGQYRFINADKVFDGEFQTKNKLTGEFDLSGKRTGDTVQGYFAYIETLNGFSKTLYMTKDEVVAHAKKYSKAYKNQNTPWHTEFDAMALKTVLRSLLTHYGFLSVEMVGALDNDIQGDMEDQVNEKIKNNANKKDMSFTDAEIIDDSKNGEEVNGQEEGEKCPI